MPSTVFEKVTLEGKYVRLEPLTHMHADGLRHAVLDGELWKLFYTLIPSVERVEGYIDTALSQYVAGQGLAFVTIDKASGVVVGSTRFMHSDLANKRTEIGATFLAKA